MDLKKIFTCKIEGIGNYSWNIELNNKKTITLIFNFDNEFTNSPELNLYFFTNKSKNLSFNLIKNTSQINLYNYIKLSDFENAII